MAGLNKKKAAATIDQAALHLQRAEWSSIEPILRPVWLAKWPEARVGMMLGEALRQLGRHQEAKEIFQANVARFPGDAVAESQLGTALAELGQMKEAVEVLGRVRSKLPKDPQILTTYASALMSVGRAEEAESHLARAMLIGGGDSSRLVLAFVKFRRGQFDEAERLAVQAAGSPDRSVGMGARALRADIQSVVGNRAGAWDLWKSIDDEGQLLPSWLASAANAAELAGHSAIADALIARRIAQGADAVDLVGFAQLANLRGQPEKALEWLAQAETATVTEDAEIWRFQLRSNKGRALRKLGRIDEALTELREAEKSPLASVPRVGVGVLVDLGMISLDRGEFLEADALFVRALALDPGEPEAIRGRELANKRLSWREAFEASADERVETAKAEAESFRRRALIRETEVDRLKRELEKLKAERRSIEEDVRVSREDQRRIEDESRRKLSTELEQRDADIESKAVDNLERAFGPSHGGARERLWQLLLTAERTFQKSLYMDLPAAAVAVLFSGAFERSLGELLFQDFATWLDAQSARVAFLEDGVRERRGTRVEYFDRFFDSLDPSLDARPPSLGEIARVLDRRNERYLSRFQRYLDERFALPPSFWDAFSRFVTWSKETLRDPVAHGHIDIDWDGVKRFRESLLFEFDGSSPGALPRLLQAEKK